MVYFITNRQPNDNANPTDFGPTVSDAGIHSLRFGQAEVVRSAQGEWSVASVSAAYENLSEHPPILGSITQFKDLREKMRGGADVFAFIHGFNVSFEAALIDAAQMGELYSTPERPLIPMVFSWPSAARLSGYINDRAIAKAAAPALARAMLKAIDFLHEIDRNEACNNRIHLLAHSMGNYVLRHALQEIRAEHPRALPRAFGEIVLVAADEDGDAFDCDFKFAYLTHMARRVTVYFNRNDFALSISDKVKFNPARLGQQGPDRPHNLPGNATIVDCTEVASSVSNSASLKDWLFNEFQQHRYHTYNARVVSDLANVLRGVAQERIAEERRRYVPNENKYVIQG